MLLLEIVLVDTTCLFLTQESGILSSSQGSHYRELSEKAQCRLVLILFKKMDHFVNFTSSLGVRASEAAGTW